jgi:hypothetical protein
VSIFPCPSTSPLSVQSLTRAPRPPSHRQFGRTDPPHPLCLFCPEVEDEVFPFCSQAPV